MGYGVEGFCEIEGYYMSQYHVIPAGRSASPYNEDIGCT